MSCAFYVSDRGGFVSTELTRGPWDPGLQHAGPPAALIARELERVPAEGEWMIGRITYEILGPIPIARLQVSAEVVRPGRSVELLAASLCADGTEVVRASAWRVRAGELKLPPGLAGVDRDGAATPATLAGAVAGPFIETGESVGYHSAMEYRFVSGGFVEPGPAVVWMRMRRPLVDDEEPTPLQRVLVAADSGNGVSSSLSFDDYLFINVDLTVQLHRLPVGEWVCLDAITVPEPTGLGVSDSSLHDERGPIGRALQTLVVRER